MRSKVLWGTIILLSATTFAACQPSQSVDAAAREPEQLSLEAPEPVPAASVTVAQPKKTGAKTVKPSAAPKTMAANSAAKTADATPAAADSPALELRPVDTKYVDTKQDEEESIATTIVGCLVQDDAMFQLKDTDGQHAPKSRSWKSGFIKKGSARVDLLGGNNRLTSHVGYRISVSGTLTDREMQVRSVRATTERCD